MATTKFKAWARKYGVGKLAEDLEVNRSTVSRWLNDNMEPSHGHRLSILALAKKRLKMIDLV